MGLIPDSKLGKIQFAESHVAPWTSNSVAMGSSAPTVTAWSAKVTAARAAYTAQTAAKLASRNATNALNEAVRDMVEATSQIITQVKAKAAFGGDSIYALASLPVPATPAPVPPPGKPTDLSVTLDDTGVLGLAWKCVNPENSHGVIYQIWRQIGEAGELKYLGGTGEKDFVDNTLPAGSGFVIYQIP
jgi:hypothetical protein